MDCVSHLTAPFFVSMAAKGYTTEGKIELYLGVDIDNSISSTITDWIEAVENWIDRYCGTTFVSAADETRYYDGAGGLDLIIDPLTAITTLQVLHTDGTVDATLTEGQANDFILYPLNATEKTKVSLVPSARIGAWPEGQRAVLITGRFRSATAVPKPIELAATKLVSNIVEKSLKGGKLSGETLGELRLDFAAIDEAAEPLGIYNLLDQYKVYDL